jgi:hypothetical protein
MTIPKATITEDLTSQVNGMSQLFNTTQAFLPGSLCVELNGQRLRRGMAHDFVETGLQTFELALLPDLGEVITVQYEVEDTGAGYPLVIASGFDPTG